MSKSPSTTAVCQGLQFLFGADVYNRSTELPVRLFCRSRGSFILSSELCLPLLANCEHCNIVVLSEHGTSPRSLWGLENKSVSTVRPTRLSFIVIIIMHFLKTGYKYFTFNQKKANFSFILYFNHCCWTHRTTITLKPLKGDMNSIDYLVTVTPVKWCDLFGIKWAVSSLNRCVRSRKNGHV